MTTPQKELAKLFKLKIGQSAVICKEKRTKKPYRVIDGYAFKRINLTEL